MGKVLSLVLLDENSKKSMHEPDLYADKSRVYSVTSTFSKQKSCFIPASDGSRSSESIL